MKLYLLIPLLIVAVVIIAWLLSRLDDARLRRVRDVFIVFAALTVLWGTWESHDTNTRVERLAVRTNELSGSNNELLKASRARGIEVRRITRKINEQTSPEAQLRQQQAINTILTRIDCNFRQAFTEAIQALVDLGIPEASAVSIVTAQCRSLPPTAASTTTTTEPGG